MSYNEPPNYGAPPPPPPGGYGGGGDQGGYGGAGQGGYGAPGPGGYGYGGQPPKQSTLAIVSLVTGIVGVLGGCCCGWLGIIGLAGIITGVMAKKEIKESNGTKTGDGLALAGIITGAAGLVIGIVLVILVFALGAFDYSYYSDL